jgi:hypothetical protein
MFASEVAWDDMVDREVSHVLTTILAGVIIPAKDLTFGELDPWARAVDHFFQPDNRWTRENLPHSLYLAASVKDKVGFSIDNEGDGTACIADVDRLEIRIEYKYWGLHLCLQWREL